MNGIERSGTEIARVASDFSVVVGGPLYRLWCRSHLSGSMLEWVHRRVIAFALFAWLPLLVLSAIDGQLLGGGAKVPFLLDVEAHVRFLVALPLLIVAEVAVYRHMRLVAREFLVRGLIPTAEMPRFDAAIAASIRLRDSTMAELVLIAAVYGIGILVVWRHYIALDTATWYAIPSPDGSTLTLAGIWYGYVSLPLFQFLLVRWYVRVAIWARFLWRVSRIRLSLVPTHPDRLGGLGFLSSAITAFLPLATAHGALLAGQLSNRILYAGGALLDYKVEIGALLVVVAVLVVAPLLAFSRQLWHAKVTGDREYGELAVQYAREFDDKWLRSGARAGQPLLGSADIQSLADIANSVERVASMRMAPLSKQAAIQLLVATLAPLAPLMLTVMPPAVLFKTVMRMLV